MSAFKDMVERDIKNVFQNTDEFAELHTVVYDGTTYSNIPIILDFTTQQARNGDRYQSSSDHAEGIYLISTTMYAAYSDMQCVPEKDMNIWIDDDKYYIQTSSCEMGQIALGLERLDE